jgi:hypothetical protein
MIFRYMWGASHGLILRFCANDPGSVANLWMVTVLAGRVSRVAAGI